MSSDLMRADAVLPDDVRPTGDPGRLTGTVLLTGATGFVGAHLLHTLLSETSSTVLCLVRPDRRGIRGGAERVRRNLESHGLWEPQWADRIRPLAGDLRRPGPVLNESVDAVYHAAAAVNWVLPYAGLRATNVIGTLEMLRLACRSGATPFHFLSTLGVCYATGEEGRTLAEADDSWPLVGRLHLGYAQSKSVAEQLVRQARQRGLPAVIYRPTLVTGDSRTGAANPDDFLARGIAACVRMGCAPDADWSIDACPVDHVARAVVRSALDTAGRGPGVLHLRHPQPRHWRELVLWMRLRGYPVRLVPYRDWLLKLEQTAGDPGHPLHPLLGFFRARVGGLTLPETYMGACRSRVSDESTRAGLARLGLTDATLDACWLERFFASLATWGIIPALPTAGRPSEATEADGLPGFLRTYFADPDLDVRPAGPAERLSRQSILTELTSWRCGSSLGLFRQPLELASARPGVPSRLDVVIKLKAEPRHLLDVVTAAAAMCDARVGAAFERWRDRLGFSGGHLREVALYGQADERWRRLTPTAYGAAWDEQRRRGMIVMEDVSAAWMDPSGGTEPWPTARTEAAVRGLAELHAVWYERSDLSACPWLGPVFSAADMAEMSDLWSALAAHAERFFDPDTRTLHRRLLDTLGRWWRPLEQMPHTLIHNDFNPRNIALRDHGPEPILCAFDWELATSAVPQHDLAQFLCFVLPADCSPETAQHYLDLHRTALEATTGRRIAADDWRHGFGLALADLLVNRWAMYALVHAVRRQPFLESVLRTWRTLFAYYSP